VIRRIRVSGLDEDETPWHALISFEVRHYNICKLILFQGKLGVLA
jgi:hypothetical protein